MERRLKNPLESPGHRAEHENGMVVAFPVRNATKPDRKGMPWSALTTTVTGCQIVMATSNCRSVNWSAMMMAPKITRILVILLPTLLAVTALGTKTTSIAEMLSAVQRNPKISQDIMPLERDWVGDIKDEKGKVTRLRLEKGLIIAGQISLLRTYPNGSYRGSDAPVYLKEIPTIEQLRKCTTLGELKQYLGDGFPGFDAVGGPDGMRGSASWACIGPSPDKGLIYLNVFAHTFWTTKRRAKDVVQVNGIQIRRGELRPANPGNKEERRLYLSGTDMFAAEEQEKEKARKQYPQPLKDLIKVAEHPDDSNLEHLTAAIQAIRDHPDPELFHQLVQEMHEGTLQIRSLLENILLYEFNLPKLKPWIHKNEATAVGACIDALPQVKESARTDLVEIILRVCGGGRIEIEGEHGGRSVEVVITGNGFRLTLGETTHPLSGEDAQKELRRLYTKSSARQGAAPKP